eukprot:355054_1
MHMSEEARFQHHYGFYILLILVGLAALIMIPLTIFIMYRYYKHKAQLTSKTAMFKLGLFYFFVTLLFCINYCGRLLNECFGRFEYDYIFVCSTAFFYGLHFILLIYLLYSRLYYVFHDTAYHLSHKTRHLFTILVSFTAIDMLSFICIVWITNDDHFMIFVCYLFGVISIIIITISITMLYIYKLFQVIRNNENSQNHTHSKLLQSITKYTR